MKKLLVWVLVSYLLSIALAIAGCTSQNPTQEGFSIYLTRDDTPVSKMPVLSHVELAEKSVISTDNIVSYDKNTHEIELTAAAYERVTKLTVPISGKAFVVCIDKKPIYWGAFWVSFSSQSFDGVTIWVNLSAQQGNIIRLELGYPSPDFYRGEDPRSNPEIFQSLEQAGKLK